MKFTTLSALALLSGAQATSGYDSIAEQIQKEQAQVEEIGLKLGAKKTILEPEIAPPTKTWFDEVQDHILGADSAPAKETKSFKETGKTPHHPLVQADTSSTVTHQLNYNEARWQGVTSNIYMGSQNQQIEVKIDSTKDWLLVKTNACTVCRTGRFVASASSSNVIVDSSSKTDELDGVKLYGKSSTDKVALKSDGSTYVNAFSYFAIDGWEGLNVAEDDKYEYAGILGLGRQVQDSEKVDGRLYGPLLVESLVTNSQLTSEIWGLRMDSSAKTINYGQVDSSQVKSGSTLQYIDQTEQSIYWQANTVSAIKMGDNEFLPSGVTAQYNYGDSEFKAVFATGSNFIFAPSTLAFEINLRLTKGMIYTFLPATNIFEISCDQRSEYPDIHLKVGGQWLTILKDDYIANVDGTCFLTFLPHTRGDFWVLGAPLFEGYYTVFDNSNHAAAKVGFAPSVSSTKREVTSEGFPSTKLSEALWEVSRWWGIYKFMSMDEFLPVKFLYRLVASLWIKVFGFPKP